MTDRNAILEQAAALLRIIRREECVIVQDLLDIGAWLEKYDTLKQEGVEAPVKEWDGRSVGESNPHAAYCDIALQDAQVKISDKGELVWSYDDSLFDKSLAGNGYKIVPLVPTLSDKITSAEPGFIEHADDLPQDFGTDHGPEPSPHPRGAAALFQAIAHGDEQHRAWLKDALDAFFAGQPIPAVRSAPTALADKISAAEQFDATPAGRALKAYRTAMSLWILSECELVGRRAWAAERALIEEIGRLQSNTLRKRPIAWMKHTVGGGLAFCSNSDDGDPPEDEGWIALYRRSGP